MKKIGTITILQAPDGESGSAHVEVGRKKKRVWFNKDQIEFFRLMLKLATK